MAQTFDKAIKMIEAIAAHQPVGAKELSRILRMPMPTLYRFIALLESNGYVARIPGDAKYQLGLSFVRLGAIAVRPFHLSDLVHPILREVADETSESSSLQIRQGRETICIDCVESMQRIRFSPQVGRIAPLYAGAGPRVLLAYMSARERKRIIETTVLKKIGPRTITSKQELRDKLQEIEKRGYAVSEEELTQGAVAVAVPVFDLAHRVVAALTVNAPEFRMGPPEIHKALAVLRKAAAKLSQKLRREFSELFP